MILLVAYFYAGLVNPEFVTCQLAKRTKIQGEMVCIYKGPNNTIGYHYPSFSFKVNVRDSFSVVILLM